MGDPDSIPTILDRWSISARDLTRLVEQNPSLRGVLFGYVAEHQLLKQLLASSPDIVDLGKTDDHDRGSKGDLVITFKDQRIKIEGSGLLLALACPCK